MIRQRQRHSRQAGVALIIVLWTIVLLTLLVSHIEAAGRSEAQLALNLRRSAALRAQADGAIAVGAFHLLDRTQHWPATGQIHWLGVRHGEFTRAVAIRISDQSGKINPNTAPLGLLRALIEAVGATPAAAVTIAANIGAWRFPAGAASQAGPYKQAGLAYAPPGAPFESRHELGLVVGMTPKLLAALWPHLTLFHHGNPNLAFADPVVRHALATAGTIPADDNPHPPGLRIVAITATASGPGGVQFTRRAIAQVGRQKYGWLKILTWTSPIPPTTARPQA